MHLDVALTWMSGTHLVLASAGLCATVVIREGHDLQPLHPIDSLRQMNPSNPMGEASSWIVARALASAPDDLLAGARVLSCSLGQNDHLALLSPSLAVPVVELGFRPQAPPRSPEAWLDWFEEVAKISGNPKDEGLAVALLMLPNVEFKKTK